MEPDLPEMLELFAKRLLDGDLYDTTRRYLTHLIAEGKPTTCAKIGSGRTTAGAIWALWYGKIHPELADDSTSDHKREDAAKVMAALKQRARAIFKDPIVPPVWQAAHEVAAARIDTARKMLHLGEACRFDMDKWRPWVMERFVGIDPGTWRDMTSKTAP